MGGFPDLQTAQVNGANLAYLDRGTGESAVFVHGTSQDVRTWLGQVDAFSAEYRTIMCSRRYARPNDDIPAGQDDQMDPHVDDLAALIRRLGAAPAHLVGNSWGGFICLLLAIREPSLVKSLVLCEAPVLPLFISNEPKPSELIRLFLRRPLDAFRIARFGLGVIEPTAKRTARVTSNAVRGYSVRPCLARRGMPSNRLPEHRC